MKILKIAGLVAVILIITVLGIRFLGGPEDDWICQNGQWVKHGQPSAPKPTIACGGQTQNDISDLIVVDSPKPNEIVTSPLVITGQARGTWFFEASFPVELRDEQNKLIAQTPAQAKGDWMTTEFVSFEAVLTFSPLNCLGLAYPCSIPATLVLKKDNPSGLPQFDDSISIPIRISEQLATSTVKVFFNNNNLDKEITCNKVFPVERQVAKTAAVARQALEELLKGPTAEEKNQGYFTNINPGVKIQKLTIADGIAKVDFDETLEKAVGGSCRVSAIRAEITETLKQFFTIKDVIISINGRTEDILQP